MGVDATDLGKLHVSGSTFLTRLVTALIFWVIHEARMLKKGSKWSSSSRWIASEIESFFDLTPTIWTRGVSARSRGRKRPKSSLLPLFGAGLLVKRIRHSRPRPRWRLYFKEQTWMKCTQWVEPYATTHALFMIRILALILKVWVRSFHHGSNPSLQFHDRDSKWDVNDYRDSIAKALPCWPLQYQLCPNSTDEFFHYASRKANYHDMPSRTTMMK